MNHCISFIWSSLDKAEGWNSLSIHFFAASASAKLGVAKATAASATDANRLFFIGIPPKFFTPLVKREPNYQTKKTERQVLKYENNAVRIRNNSLRMCKNLHQMKKSETMVETLDCDR